MRLKFILFTAFFFLAQNAFVLAADQFVEIDDPVADYILRNKDALRSDTQKNEHVIKLEVDINNDGNKELFISSEKSCLFDAANYENRVYIWDIYQRLPNGRYTLTDRKKADKSSPEKYIAGQNFDFDPSMIYVGYIAEIKAWGILATYYLPKHNAVSFSAFVLRNGYFEELNFPTPSEAVGIYHRDDANNIVDLPQGYTHYVASPSVAKVVTLPQTY